MPSFSVQAVNNQILMKVAVSVPPVNDIDGVFNAMVDTGAQGTLISQRVVDHLQVDSIDIRSFVSANGQAAETSVFRLHIGIPVVSNTVSEPDGSESVEVFSRGFDLDVLLLPFLPANFDVLLGMDVLSQFHVTMYNGLFVCSN